MFVVFETFSVVVFSKAARVLPEDYLFCSSVSYDFVQNEKLSKSGRILKYIFRILVCIMFVSNERSHHFFFIAALIRSGAITCLLLLL